MTAVYTSHAVSHRLLLGWCAWLLISWLLHLLLESPGRMWVMLADGTLVWRVPSEALGNVVLGMFQSMLIGIGLIWPLWRLNTPSIHSPGTETLNDAVVLFLVAQVVVLPMRLLMDLSPQQLLGTDVVFLLAVIAAGLCTWMGRGAVSPWGRTWAMGLCIAVLFGPWVLAYATGFTRIASYSFFDMLGSLGRMDTLVQGSLVRGVAVWCCLLAPAWAALAARGCNPAIENGGHGLNPLPPTPDNPL